MSTSISEALQPLANRIRGQFSAVQPVSQVNLVLGGKIEGSVFVEARDTLLKFLQHRSGRPLPVEAFDGKSFAVDEIGAQRTEAVAIEQSNYWAARLDDADKTIAQRTWTIEIALAAQADGSALFGSRLQCISRGEYTTFERTIPRFVRDIIGVCDAKLDGRRITDQPWLIQSQDDADNLVRLISDPNRKSDVLVLSLPEGSEDWSQAALPVDRVARKLAGAAHVAVVTADASFHLSDLVGKEFSVFRQAVRTYRPQFNASTDEPFAHPLGLATRISSWEGGPEAYERFLVSNLLAKTVGGGDREQRLPPFAEAKRIASELRRANARKGGSSADELLKLAEDEINDLKKTLKESTEEYSSLYDLAISERDASFQDVQQEKQKNFFLRQRIQAIEAQLKSRGAISEEIPENLDVFEDWCRKHLSGSVEVHNRAFHGVKKSQYEDISLIYKSLLLMRDCYVPMKRNGGIDLKETFEGACRELGIEEQSSFSGAGWGEQGDTYVVKIGSRRVLLDRHLKKGNSREERHCFRLYFAWDDENDNAIVGWLPSHLETRAS